MDVTVRKRLAARLRRRGFDGTRSGSYGVKVRCSQCASLIINGVACHERGCLNQKRK